MTDTSRLDTGNGAGAATWLQPDSRDTDRYGVFFRPDPLTCRTLAELHYLLQRQHGLTSASAFPPHGTLLGNIAIHGSERDLAEAIAAAARSMKPITVHNTGPQPSGTGSITCDVHYDEDGAVNESLRDLARLVGLAIEPLRSRTDSDFMTGHMTSDMFHGHLTIAGQDLVLRTDLHDEVAQFVAALKPQFPETFVLDTVSLFRFRSRHWSSQWWQDMAWTHLKSWALQ